MPGFCCQLGKGKGRYQHGLFKIISAGIVICPFQLGLVRKTDSVNRKIQLIPMLAQLAKGIFNPVLCGNITFDKDIRAYRGCQRLQPFAKALYLIGKGQLCPVCGRCLGNAPGSRAFIGNAHNQAFFSSKDTHFSRTPLLYI